MGLDALCASVVTQQAARVKDKKVFFIVVPRTSIFDFQASNQWCWGLLLRGVLSPQRLYDGGHILLAEALLNRGFEEVACIGSGGQLNSSFGGSLLRILQVLGHQLEHEVDRVVAAGHAGGDVCQERTAGCAVLQDG